MNAFLKNTGLFLTASLSLFLLKFGLLAYLNTKQLTNFTIDPTIESVAVGDSHVQLAINDKLLPNTINLSQLGDPFNYSLLKINVALQKKPSIKRIYLGLSYHNLSSYYDDYISGKYAAGIDARYLFILPNQGKLAVLKENISNLNDLLRLSFINGFSNSHGTNKRFSFLGKYDNPYKNTQADKKQMNRRLTEQFYDNGKLRDFSVVNTHYLNEIVELCRKRDVELVILNTPLHPYYRSKVPAKFIEKFNSFVNQNRLRLVDLSQLALKDSCYTVDGDHVSEKGALLTTNEFLMGESTNGTKMVKR